MRRRLTHEQRWQILYAYLVTKEPAVSIARRFRVSQNYPTVLARRFGVPMRAHPVSRAHMAAAQTKRWAERRAA